MFNKVIIKGSIPLKSWFIHTETKKICNDNLALAADTVMQTFGKVPPPPISKVLHHKRNYKMAVPSRTKTYGKEKIDTKIQNLEKKQ